VDDMNISPFLIPVIAIVGTFVYVIIKTLAQSRVRELEIRERIAMIERGMVPAPEVDPRGFDRAMSRLDRHDYVRHSSGGRHRRAGVTMIGVGFGLMVLIAFTSGEESIAVGVGGFLVVVGLAFFVNSFIDGSANMPTSDPRPWSAPPAPPTSTEPPRPTNG
jgi:hypothetical protein